MNTNPHLDLDQQKFLDPAREWRRICAEAWGTFFLVLVAAGGKIMAASNPEVNLSMATIAAGLIVMAVIYALGAVSGAHINPAITLAFALRQNFPWSRVPGYLGAQLLGGLAAAGILKWIFGSFFTFGRTVPGAGIEVYKAGIIELILTAGLVNFVLSTARGARNVGPNAGIAIGGYIAVCGLWADKISGASMNPVRSLAPDIVQGDLSSTWIYLCATLAGMLIGVGLEWILCGTPDAHASMAAQGSPDG